MNSFHVSWKGIDIDNQLKTDYSNSLNLIGIGSYGLHFMCSAYRSTRKATEWPFD